MWLKPIGVGFFTQSTEVDWKWPQMLLLLQPLTLVYYLESLTSLPVIIREEVDGSSFGSWPTLFVLAPIESAGWRTGEAIVRWLCAGLAAQPNKKQLSIAFVKVASEALRATQVRKEVE